MIIRILLLYSLVDYSWWKVCEFIFFALSTAIVVVVWACAGFGNISWEFDKDRLSPQSLFHANWVNQERSEPLCLRTETSGMAAGENGLFFVHKFKSIYTEYTIEIIVPEGYLTRLVTS